MSNPASRYSPLALREAAQYYAAARGVSYEAALDRIVDAISTRAAIELIDHPKIEVPSAVASEGLTRVLERKVDDQTLKLETLRSDLEARDRMIHQLKGDIVAKDNKILALTIHNEQLVDEASESFRDLPFEVAMMVAFREPRSKEWMDMFDLQVGALGYGFLGRRERWTIRASYYQFGRIEAPAPSPKIPGDAAVNRGDSR